MFFPPVIGRSVLVVTADPEDPSVTITRGVIEGYLIRTTAEGEDERILVRTSPRSVLDVPADCVLSDSYEIRDHVEKLIPSAAPF